MAINNVSTYGSLQTLLQNMSQVQGTMSTEQVEISSGLKSQTFDGLNGTVQQFSALSSQVTKLQAYQQSNTQVEGQLQAMSSVLGNLSTIATNIQEALTSGPSSAAYQQDMASYVTDFMGAINTTYAGSYLFSGTATDTPPVVSPLPAVSSSNASAGTLSTDYYQGSSQNVSWQINDNASITNTVRADAPAFQNLVAGIAAAQQLGTEAAAASSSSTPTTYSTATAESLIANAISGINSLQSAVNSNVVAMKQNDTQSTSLQTYYTSVVDSMTQSDEVALSAQVAQEQNILTASYEAFARISSLTLANFLK